MQRPLRKGLHAWLHESGEAKTVLIVLKIWKNDNAHDLKFQLLYLHCSIYDHVTMCFNSGAVARRHGV
jgi:hypothetical protein